MTETIFNYGRAKLRMLFRQMHALVEAIDKPAAKLIVAADAFNCLDELLVTLKDLGLYNILQRVLGNTVLIDDIFDVLKVSEEKDGFPGLPTTCTSTIDALSSFIRKLSSSFNTKVGSVIIMKELKVDGMAKLARLELMDFVKEMVLIEGGDNPN